MVRNQEYSRTGSIASGTSTVSVANTTNINVGDIVSIEGAGEVWDGQRKVLYGQVQTVGASSFTIDATADTDANSTTVRWGVAGVRVFGGTFDGNKSDEDGPNHFPIQLSHCNGGQIVGVTVRNGDHGGVMIDKGSRNCLVDYSTFTDNGHPADVLGSAVWLFRCGGGNVVKNCTMTGGTYGVVIDDRTSTESIYDTGPTGNTVTRCTITGTSQGGVGVDGASQNTVTDNDITDTLYGVVVSNTSQGTSEFRDAESNVVTNNRLTDCTRGLYLKGVTTSYSGNTFTNCGTDVVDDE